jgi:two-component system, NtrC family, sensor histidine kinase HydH
MKNTSKYKFIRTGCIAALVLIITILHFKTNIDRPYLHQIYQRSYYIPIVLAGFWFELLGALATAIGLAILFIAHIWHDWSHHPDYTFQQYAEIPMYFVIAILVGYLSRLQRITREKLETAGTEVSTAYKKLNDAFDQLRHADRLASLGQLAAGIAHEIRNPLASIKGAVDILGQNMPADDPKSEFAQIACKEASRIEKLTGEILQFSKPVPPQKMRTDPHEIIESARRLVADQARRLGVVLNHNAVESNATIFVDPEQVKQVLINILINGIQAQPNGGALQISVRTEAEECIMAVQDSGPGMTQDQLERIFDPFYTTKREGTGLGLSISYQMVKNNGGRIWAASNPGNSSCFYISFPLL